MYQVSAYEALTFEYSAVIIGNKQLINGLVVLFGNQLRVPLVEPQNFLLTFPTFSGLLLAFGHHLASTTTCPLKEELRYGVPAFAFSSNDIGLEKSSLLSLVYQSLCQVVLTTW